MPIGIIAGVALASAGASAVTSIYSTKKASDFNERSLAAESDINREAMERQAAAEAADRRQRDADREQEERARQEYYQAWQDQYNNYVQANTPSWQLGQGALGRLGDLTGIETGPGSYPGPISAGGGPPPTGGTPPAGPPPAGGPPGGGAGLTGLSQMAASRGPGGSPGGSWAPPGGARLQQGPGVRGGSWTPPGAGAERPSRGREQFQARFPRMDMPAMSGGVPSIEQLMAMAAKRPEQRNNPNGMNPYGIPRGQG